ncbi:MAG: aminotransferase class I/II-fold pyridoxal phosphate-dependent enzyme [Thermoplasmata archaeon]|nr:aminotransferase class I/II-fold pyridoxal phosphate-dependent enzyme [Thermoplasmata archaeon]
MTLNPRFEPSPRTKDIRYAIRDVVVVANKLKKAGHNILHLNIGDPNAYDFDTPEHIKEGAIKGITEGHNGYAPSEGIRVLGEAISTKEQKDGRDIWTDDVLVTAGVTEGLQMLFANLEGKRALIPAPVYPPYTTYAKFYGAVPVEYPGVEELDWQPDIDFIRRTLEKDTKKEIAALCIINPNNPTGAFYPEKTVRELMAIAGEYGLMVISDEIYDLMLYDRDVVKPATHGKDADVPLIILNGISKVYFAPGWRIGYMAFRDNGGLKEFRESILRQARARLCPNFPCQYGYLAALQGPNTFLKEGIDRLRKRRDYSVKRINEMDGLSTRVPEGAFYMFPKIGDGTGDDYGFVMDILHNCHVLFVHGSGFSAEYGKGHFRMVFLPDPDTLKEAFDRIEDYLKKRSRRT